MDSIITFLNYLNQFQQISNDLHEFLYTSLKEYKVHKNHALIKVGQHQRELYYLVSGSARVYAIDAETQREHILWFWHQQQIILPFEGVGSKLKSETGVLLNENATIISLSLIHLKYLPQLFPEYVLLAQQVLEKLINNLTQHLQTIKHNNAQQRYNQLMKHHPHLFSTVQLKDIASFLGMSLNTLNHIRALK